MKEAGIGGVPPGAGTGSQYFPERITRSQYFPELVFKPDFKLYEHLFCIVVVAWHGLHVLDLCSWLLRFQT